MKIPDDLIFRFPSNSCKNFYLLADLQGGIGGHVWLACSTSFEVIILKFPLKESTRELEDLENEASAWYSIYGVNAHVRKINCVNVLVMPYVYMFSESDWDDEELLQVAM